MKKIFLTAFSVVMASFLCACGPCEVHEFGAWEIQADATCTQTGMQIRSCQKCDATETAEIPTVEHVLTEWITLAEPSCTAAGTQQRPCMNCDYAVTEEISPLEHEYGEWLVTADAGCENSGEKSRVCTRCGLEDTKKINATGHNYENYVCTVCQEEQYKLCETGEFYEGPDGLSVKVISFEKTEREGYFLYRLKYTLTNQVEDSAIDEGIFRIHMADGTYEPQYGFFDKLFYKDSKNFIYEWKVLKTQEVVLLEYISWEMNMNFVQGIVPDTLHWIAP